VIYIYAVHVAGGTSHEHISSVRWKDPDSGQTGQDSRAQMVGWITQGGAAYVCGGGGHMARVGVVNATTPYLRTHADGYWSDNLLALSRY
jgi:hypothetical protein